MKKYILLLILTVNYIVHAQNVSFITYVNIPQKDLSNCQFYKEFSKIKNDSCFYEFIEIAEIKNINRIKNNLSPLYLKKDRNNILKFIHYDYSDKPIYINDSIGTQIAYNAYESDIELQKADSVEFLLKFNILDSVVQCDLLGIKFFFNQKNEGYKETPIKNIYYDWNDLKIKDKMFNFYTPFNFYEKEMDFIYIESAIIGYQSFLYEGYFSFDYFKKYTLEKFIFLEELNKLYTTEKFNLLFSVENSKLKINMQER